MAGHATFYKTDDLAAFLTGFAHQTLFRFNTNLVFVAVHIPLFKHLADSIGNGKDHAVLVEDRVFAANAFQSPYNLFPRYIGPEGQRDQPADCFGFSPGDLPDIPIVANISKGLPSISVTVT
jgi:hypothetical protein